MTHADAIVVPHGGVKPFFGTNPLSFGLPVEGEEPLLLDMATSSIPLNRVLLRRATSTPLPPDVAVDAEGEMTTDPHRAAAVLSLGGLNFGYKGAGLACMIDLLCSAFTGMAHGFLAPAFGGPDFATPTRLGHFFVVLRPDLFQPADRFRESVSDLVRDLRAQPAQPGMRVMAPSDPEKPEAAERARIGIPLDLTTWRELRGAADRHGVEVPTPVEG